MASNEPQLIEVGRIADRRGNLSVLQSPGAIPFTPASVRWLTDVPAGMTMPGHALKSSCSVILALSGCFEIETVTANGAKQTFRLSRPDQALLIPPMTWHSMHDFATNSVALIVTDTAVDTNGRINSFDTFHSLCNDRRP